MSQRYDLVVLGGGPGGYVAAIRGAQLGLRVAVVERERVGGVCLNWGCIPTKALLASAELLANCRRAEAFGLTVGSVDVDREAIQARKDRIVERLVSGVETLIRKKGVDLYSGEATLVGPGETRVETSEGATVLESGKVILATGSRPIVPRAFPYDGRRVVTSRDVLAMTRPPDRIVVVGAGAVGCEFAGYYAALGHEVTMVEMLPTVLPGEDASATRLIATLLKRRGVGIRTGSAVEGIEVADDAVRTTLADGETIESGIVLLAMGRRPAVEGSGIPECGVAVRDGAVEVNDAMETSLPGVYAIGDLVGGWMLAHVASREGIVAATRAAGGDATIDYAAVPRCTFTHPEVAAVGLTEAQAKERGIELATGRFPFSASGKAVAEEETAGFVKVIAEAGSGRIVGGVVVGPRASDLVHEIALAVECGLTLDRLAGMIHAHPTLSEAVMEAAEAGLGLSIHST